MGFLVGRKVGTLVDAGSSAVGDSVCAGFSAVKPADGAAVAASSVDPVDG